MDRAALMADTLPESAALADMPAFSAPHITRLRLTNFRSHGALDIACRGGAVIITGANGLGKTNILEAVSMLAAGRGLRSAALEEMQRYRSGGWSVLADIDTPMGGVRAGVGFAVGEAGKTGRQVRIDGDNARVDDLARLVPQLWLTPAMDRLFSDGAAGRRKFLDRFAQSLDAGLSRHIASYEKAMRERNRLLQTPGTAFDTNSWLDGLEEEMALHGVAIAAARLIALDALAVGLDAIPEAAFPRASVALEGVLEAALRHQSALDVEDGFFSELRAARHLDAGAGRALSGPHRSDLQVVYAAKNMPAGDCSTGEQKALLVGLILAQAHSVAARTGDVPLLLLDEVAAHLDSQRRAALAEILSGLGGQSWITGTDAAAFSGFVASTAITLNDSETAHGSA
jgi:DNA replication and repair protein RecF